MKERQNYGIISTKSDFLLHLVTKHILQLNIDAGLYPERAMFGSFILVDDKEEPKPPQKYVISHKQRGDGFKTINLDEDPLPTLYEILGVDEGCREYKLFVRNKVYNRKSTTPNSLYYYMVMLRECIKPDGGFNNTKADLILDSMKYESRSSALDKYKALNSYVNNPSEESLFTLIKVFGDNPDPAKRFSSIAFTIKNILEDNVPAYIESRLSFSQDNAVILQYLILAAEVAVYDDMDTFVSSLIARLV